VGRSRFPRFSNGDTIAIVLAVIAAIAAIAIIPIAIAALLR
jgi:hypothetical protein